MKIYIASLVTLAAGAESKHTLGYQEFLEAVTGLGQRMMGYMQFKEIPCPADTGFQAPCYKLTSKKNKFGFGGTEFEKSPPYDVLIHFGAIHSSRAHWLVDLPATHATVVSEGDPKCEPIIIGLKEIGNALVGESKLEITDAAINDYNKQYSAGVDIDIPNPFTGTSLFSYKWSEEEVKRETKNDMAGTTFIAPKGEVCLPVTLKLALKCDFTKRKLTIFDQHTIVHSEPSEKSLASLLPINPITQRKLFPISGCISEYIP